MNLSQIKELFRNHNIRLRKSLGQNLLLDSNILRLFTDACKITKKDTVLEIGAGTGALTVHLAKQAGKIIAIETDEKLLEIAKSLLSDYSNIEWLHGDIMKLDVNDILKNYSSNNPIITGNLPYYITTPIIMNILENKIPFQRLVVTIQKEVAMRIVAKPGTKDYGVLTLMIQYRCQSEYIKTISRNCFFPVPDVDSAIIRLTPHLKSLVTVQDEELFFLLIRTAFNRRRKMLMNALEPALDKIHLTKEDLGNLLNELEIPPKIRGEKLSLQDYARLTNRLIEIRNQSGIR